MFKSKPAPVRTIKRPHYRGNKAALVAIDSILDDNRYQLQVRHDMIRHIVKAAITTETVEVYEKVVSVQEAA